MRTQMNHRLIHMMVIKDIKLQDTLLYMEVANNNRIKIIIIWRQSNSHKSTRIPKKINSLQVQSQVQKKAAVLQMKGEDKLQPERFNTPNQKTVHTFKNIRRREGVNELKIVKAKERCSIAIKQIKFKRMQRRSNKSWSRKKIYCNKLILILPKQLKRLKHRVPKYYKICRTPSKTKFSTKKKNKRASKKRLSRPRLSIHQQFNNLLSK